MLDLLAAELERCPDPESESFKGAAIAVLEKLDANAAAESDSKAKD
jgi:hypothetical protein